MQTNIKSISAKNEISSILLLGILSALMAMTSLSVDIYLPAMPKMHQMLHGEIELTITGFLIGFSIFNNRDCPRIPNLGKTDVLLMTI